MAEVRNLGYLEWKDPLAWMEKMKGKKWQRLIKKEKDHYNELASQVTKETRQMEKEIEYAQQYSNLSFKIGDGNINIGLVPNARFEWNWIWSKTKKPAEDIDIQGNIVWYITTDEDKNYKNSLICEDSTGKTIWTKNAVSSEIAIIDELCYYIKVVEYYRTVEVCVCNARTGNQERILYKEKDEKRELMFIKGTNKTLYFKSDEPLGSILYKIKGLEIEQLYKRSTFQMPLGESIYGDDCVLIRKSHFDKWEAKGRPINEWIFPEEEPNWIDIQSGLTITMLEGSHTIWYCSDKKPKILFKIRVGFIEPNIWSIWEESLMKTFNIKTPFETPFIINIINKKVYKEKQIKIDHPIQFKPVDVHRYHSISKDGTKVPYVVVKEKGIVPKGQFVYVYGAYGSTTPIGWPYQNWYPLLKRGWALVFAMVRGGGDVDAAWAEMARRNNRHVSVDDFESVIRNSQKRLKLSPDKTVIYGRSAGGLPVGAIVSRFPNGELVGAAFTEVPYVDVLRTSSNPDLPLTVGEFNEYGNPLENILNFKELLSVSPVNTLPTYGAPGVFVMSHVGLLDKQVFAYESFKWIHMLRGISEESNRKYVTFEEKEAHQYRPKKMPRFRAKDLAILDKWIDGKLKF